MAEQKASIVSYKVPLIVGVIIFIIFVMQLYILRLDKGSSVPEKKENPKPEVSNSNLLPQKEEQKYETKSFDTKVTSLPTNYLGHDIVALYQQLTKEFPPKDEFESTEAYGKRLKVGYPQDIFAFVIDEAFLVDTYGIDISYNADEQRMVVEIKGERPDEYNPYDEETVILTKGIEGKKETYVGTNKFGVEKIVTKYHCKHYGIFPVNKKLFLDKEYSVPIRGPLKISFKISSEEARDLKTNFGTLLICKIKLSGNPLAYTFQHNEYIGATIDTPTAVDTERFFVNAELIEIWVFNSKTGTVFTKKIIMPNARGSRERQTKKNNDK